MNSIQLNACAIPSFDNIVHRVNENIDADKLGVLKNNMFPTTNIDNDSHSDKKKAVNRIHHLISEEVNTASIQDNLRAPKFMYTRDTGLISAINCYSDNNDDTAYNINSGESNRPLIDDQFLDSSLLVLLQPRRGEATRDQDDKSFIELSKLKILKDGLQRFPKLDTLNYEKLKEFKIYLQETKR